MRSETTQLHLREPTSIQIGVSVVPMELGQMARKQEIARLALIISTLLQSGIVLLQALEIATRAMRNVVLRDALETCYTDIQTGREIGEALDCTTEAARKLVSRARTKLLALRQAQSQ